jgi:isoquinoline 1-oxidoreductase beta subunit
MNQAPKIELIVVDSTEKPGGIGEPSTSLIGPAIANAVYNITGKRVRKMPLSPANIQSA